MYKVEAPTTKETAYLSVKVSKIADVIDYLLRITIRATKESAGDILYEIKLLKKDSDNQIEHNRLIGFRNNGVSSCDATTQNGETYVEQLPHGIELWLLCYNPNSRIITLRKVRDMNVNFLTKI